MIRLELPLPPSVNRWKNPRVVRVGGKTSASMYKTQEQRNYVTTVRFLAKVVCRTPLTGSLCYHLDIYFPDARRRDGSNYLKALEDSLQGVAYDDDSQIKRRCIRDLVDKKDKKGRVVLWLASLLEWRELLQAREGIDGTDKNTNFETQSEPGGLDGGRTRVFPGTIQNNASCGRLEGLM